MRLSRLFILIGFLGLSSCIDPFIPDTEDYESVFFIEALLNNDTINENLVKISYSIPVSSASNPTIGQPPEKVRGAQVELLSSDGNSYVFNEKSTGYYYAPENWKPEMGKEYQLIINHQGERFESRPQSMRAADPIEDINYKHKVERVGETGFIYSGYRFSVSTRNNLPDPSYYRWETEATYMYKAAYEATHIYSRNRQVPASNSHLMYCWSKKSPKGIYTATTEGLSQNIILDAPLHFESQYGDALSIRYSLLVKQFVISKEAYDFWKELVNQIAQSGGLYETQPYRVKGNISCTSNPNILISGIFEIASWSEKRIYVNKPTEFEIQPIVCRLDTIGTESLPWYRIPSGSYILYDVAADEYFYANPPCFDCSLKGGTLQKPAFWEDGI
jgi:hypothetical protein